MNFSIDSGDQISPAPQESSPAFVSHLMSMADSISSIVPSGFGSFGGNRVSGKEVFFCSDVQLYFISPPEEQRTISPLPFQLVTLRIVMLNPNNQVGGQPPAYIDAESWFYPLIPLQSPVLRTTQGHYIFPDVTSNASGGSVGIILPSSVTPEIRHTFETLLLTLCGLTNFPSEETTNISELFRRDANSTTMNIVTTITDGMVAVAEIASEGISEGTTKTVQLLSEGVNYEKMQLPQSVDPVIIPPAVKETVESVMEYTGKVVALSSVVARIII
ncbi:spartin [Folsomia candida]|uniref:spartin n=1 Tax=Folsomia candida TaxID=158441 RepID=UPI0016053FF4|nr:spartin [Folsomia candida]